MESEYKEEVEEKEEEKYAEEKEEGKKREKMFHYVHSLLCLFQLLSILLTSI